MSAEFDHSILPKIATFNRRAGALLSVERLRPAASARPISPKFGMRDAGRDRSEPKTWRPTVPNKYSVLDQISSEQKRLCRSGDRRLEAAAELQGQQHDGTAGAFGL